MKYLSYRSLDEQELERLVKEMIDVCKAKGAKVTTQRILIFKELAKRTKEHPSAEELYENLKGKVYGLSLSTVYRALSTFEQLGLVRRIPTPDGKAHYEIAVEPHGHFICQNCNKVVDVEGIKLDERLKEEMKELGFTPSECNFVCYGLCKDCSN
ncbi:MAG: transcriptional repressor [Aquificae bacterium]|nr:transcriptional repressor [Aquificota bacterium]